MQYVASTARAWYSAEKFWITGTSPRSRRIPGTETYVALKLGIDNWRWAGVPFYLRTGKYLSARTTEIAVQFRQAPYALFRDTPVERLPANILWLRIQPDEGLSLSFSAKRPGAEIEIDGVEMDFAYRDYFAPIASVGYETLIYDCLIGDATLFQRADTVEAAWRAVQGLLDAWARAPADDLTSYAAGSDGPDAADRLLARDGRAWLSIRSGQRTPPSAPERADRGDSMRATRVLHDLGQSIWLDNITRNLLRTGTLRRYIDEFSVTGLTSNPTIFDHAIKNSQDYDDAIKSKLAEGKSGEKLFFELALEDLTQAADLFRPVHDRTCGVDGWVSLEVSPLLAHDTRSTIAVAKDLHARARRPNVMIKIPGTPKACRPLKRRSLRGCRSTSRCCSPTTSTWRQPKRSCAASNGASKRD